MIGGTEHNFHKSKKAEEHKKNLKAKTNRLDRRSGTGRPRNESPKKNGSGSKTVWGSFHDDITDYMDY
ncbi:hypothetical protein BSKO_03175 [Bryopsis sp. KO-2023]|nr:hypothetical protein BSKO_03175 [Bryopsis sp. KO-2023]